MLTNVTPNRPGTKPNTPAKSDRRKQFDAVCGSLGLNNKSWFGITGSLATEIPQDTAKSQLLQHLIFCHRWINVLQLGARDHEVLINLTGNLLITLFTTSSECVAQCATTIIELVTHRDSYGRNKDRFPDTINRLVTFLQVETVQLSPLNNLDQERDQYIISLFQKCRIDNAKDMQKVATFLMHFKTLRTIESSLISQLSNCPSVALGTLLEMFTIIKPYLASTKFSNLIATGSIPSIIFVELIKIPKDKVDIKKLEVFLSTLETAKIDIRSFEAYTLDLDEAKQSHFVQFMENFTELYANKPQSLANFCQSSVATAKSFKNLNTQLLLNEKEEPAPIIASETSSDSVTFDKLSNEEIATNLESIVYQLCRQFRFTTDGLKMGNLRFTRSNGGITVNITEDGYTFVHKKCLNGMKCSTKTITETPTGITTKITILFTPEEHIKNVFFGLYLIVFELVNNEILRTDSNIMKHLFRQLIPGLHISYDLVIPEALNLPPQVPLRFLAGLNAAYIGTLNEKNYGGYIQEMFPDSTFNFTQALLEGNADQIVPVEVTCSWTMRVSQQT